MSDPLTPTAPGAGAEPPIPELLRLGQQLAQARQTAGISQEALTQRLRLAPRQLKALEEGDHARLPEGVFVLALARRVAGSLNADVEEALQALRESRLMRRSGPPVRPAARTRGGADTVPRVSPAPAPRESASRAADFGPGGPTGEASPPSAPTASVVTREESVVPRSGPNPWPLAALVALVAAGALATAWMSRPRPSPRVVSTAPASPAAADTLRLQAREPSWLEVRNLEGRTLFEGTLTGEKRFPIGRGLEVVAGRPHAVRASVGAAPGVPLGGVTDIRWKRFSLAGPVREPRPAPASTP
ncbi:MAG: RodZ domain-containing protein [Cyanobacteriota bacterium]|nr:RodZ domain-containing protein [Cyanobacteriota bacterium]